MERDSQDASWFHWSGITPAISQGAADACKEAIKAARKLKVTVSGDINYRRNLWQYGKKVTDIMPELIEGTNYVLGGSTDIDNSTGIKKIFRGNVHKVHEGISLSKESSTNET